MNDNVLRIPLKKNPSIFMDVSPGHYTTGNVHTNYYIDVSNMKANALVARDIARELSIPYFSSAMVDTIICMENTKVIGAFLAEELLEPGTMAMNSEGEIHVITPRSNIDGKLVFFDNEVEWIKNKNILLLMATISGGQTLGSTLECIAYYNGRITGISSLFSASDKVSQEKIHALFTSDDIPNYEVVRSNKCAMCADGQKLDAFISSDGYNIYRGENHV